MRLLWVKLSSLGDVIHAFPAVSDIAKNHLKTEITWLVEPAYEDLVARHAYVNHVCALPLRAMKSEWKSKKGWDELTKALWDGRYDLAIDAQGLLKSALALKMMDVKKRAGYDKLSAREASAAWLYSQKVYVNKQMHALDRMRVLASRVLDYTFDETPDFGIAQWRPVAEKSLICFHGTTWVSKFLPIETWREVIDCATADGYRVYLPWSNDDEFARARLMKVSHQVEILPKMFLPELHDELYKISGAISVDTGLGHLAGATGLPTIGLFGPTDRKLTGIRGRFVDNLGTDTPCMQRDCAKHGEFLDNACMQHHKGQDIWQAFLNVQQKAQETLRG